MQKVLKPHPRTYVAIAVIFFGFFGLLSGLDLYLYQWKWSGVALVEGPLVAAYVTLCIFVSRGRIVVTEDSISMRPAFGPEKHVQFRQITVSVPDVERKTGRTHGLEILADTGERDHEGRIIWKKLLAISGLRAFRQSEVAWLLSLPELKIQTRRPRYWDEIGQAPRAAKP